MKKIRLIDQTEIEIYNISAAGDALKIDILNADANAMEAVFSNADNLSTIQYYVETELTMGYAGYTKLHEYGKKKEQTINVDYAIADASTQSGFAEEKADILTITLEKPKKVEELSVETEKLRADIDYIAMETGVSV